MSVLSKAVRGSVAGVAATSAMTTYMIALERLGVMRAQPPRMIVDRVAPDLSEPAANAAAGVSHAAYGALAGAAFAQLASGRAHAPALGIVYGLVLWVAGYEGWVPVLGALPPAHRDRPARVGTMLTAHLLYGYVLGRQLGRR